MLLPISLAEINVKHELPALLKFPLNNLCCRHDFYNSATDVVLTIFAKGVPADSVVIDFGEQMVCSAHIVIVVLL